MGNPGVLEAARFIALHLDEQPRFVWLQSLDDLNVALPAADPWSLFPDYEPKVPAYATTAFEINSPEDFAVLCILVVTQDAEEMTMNLLAPVLVNLKTRKGRQVTIENGDYSVRTPVPRTPGAAAP